MSIIGKTFEGDNIVSLGLKNFALVERTGEIVTYDGHSFGLSPYMKIEVTPAHHHYTVEAIINLEKLSHNGNLLTQDEELTDLVNGTPYEFYEYENEPSTDDELIFNFLKEVFNDKDFDYDDLHLNFEEEWGIVKIGSDVCLLWEEESGEVALKSTNAELNDTFYSIYMAKAFIELDVSCFVDLKEVDSYVTMERMRAEQSVTIRAKDIELVTGVPANTISKLRSKIKKESKEKDIKNLESYINNYLFLKYLK